jgi:hypothetical protein
MKLSSVAKGTTVRAAPLDTAPTEMAASITTDWHVS